MTFNYYQKNDCLLVDCVTEVKLICSLAGSMYV